MYVGLPPVRVKVFFFFFKRQEPQIFTLQAPNEQQIFLGMSAKKRAEGPRQKVGVFLQKILDQ